MILDRVLPQKPRFSIENIKESSPVLNLRRGLGVKVKINQSYLDIHTWDSLWGNDQNENFFKGKVHHKNEAFR